jgi:hypothetical protein
MQFRPPLFSVALAAAVCVPPAAAHHSYLQYSREVRELRGELMSLQWSNPHPTLELHVRNDAGVAETWHLESFSSPYVLSRMGVTRGEFEIGSEVTIAGRVSSRDPRQMLLTHLLRADGSEVVVQANAEPFWADRAIGGDDNWVERSIATAAQENAGFFRVWSLDRIGNGAVHNPFTASAIAAREAFDEAGSYVWNCEQPGMPTAMLAAFPFEFVDAGDRLTMRVEYHDIVRTIHLGAAADGATQPPSPQGYSVGRYEDGGRRLVVETTRIDWPWFDLLGTPQSADVRITETFTLADDQSALSYRRTVVDPLTFTEPATAEATYLALGETIQPFDCRSE